MAQSRANVRLLSYFALNVQLL
ncbi:hypothetical protein H206_00383, partial [Candidatus Electrothrix aarhusensis]